MFARVLSISRFLIMLGLIDKRAVNVPMLHMVLCKNPSEDSWYLNILSSKYARF